MGFFNNMLPIHLDVKADLSLADWVRAVKGELLEVFANQDVPVERLATEPEFTAYSQKAGFYQGLFSFQDARERQHDWGGLLQENLPVMQGGATEDFGLWLRESSAGLTGGINFNADLFTRDTAQMFRRRLLALFRAAVANPQARVRELLDAPGDESREVAAWLEAKRNAVKASAAPATAPAADGAARASNELAPNELALARLWSGLLGIDESQIQPSDNFFDLGGSSLLAMQAVSEMEQKLALRVDPRRYVYESLRQLAGAGVGAAVAASGSSTVDHSGLAGIWADLLGLDAAQIQPGDNFFDLGGSSLLAMRAVTEGEQKLGLKIDPRRYVYESLRQLAAPAAATASEAPKAEAAKPAPAKSRLFGMFGRGKS
jgi:acyl carrier protein